MVQQVAEDLAKKGYDFHDLSPGCPSIARHAGKCSRYRCVSRLFCPGVGRGSGKEYSRFRVYKLAPSCTFPVPFSEDMLR